MPFFFFKPNNANNISLKGQCLCDVVDHVCLWLSLGFRRPPGQPKQQTLPLAAFTQASRNHNEVRWFRGFYGTLQLMGEEATSLLGDL